MKPKQKIGKYHFFSLFFLFSFFYSPNYIEAQDKDEVIYTLVQNMPSYPGCEDAGSEKAKQDCTMDKIMKHVSGSLIYPKDAMAEGVEGTVFVSFVVQRDGKVSDVGLLRGVPGGSSLDEEAIRIVENFPGFNPGLQKGEAVAVRYNLPIKFKLNDKNTEKD